MDKNDIYKAIDTLSRVEKIKYGIICINRVIDLYNVFDEYIIAYFPQYIGEKPGSMLLKNILQESEAVFAHDENKCVSGLIERCMKLIPFDENYEGYESIIAQNVAGTMLFVLQYYRDDDDKYIKLCTDNIIEIINNIRSAYFRKSSLDGLTERAYKMECYQREFVIEMEFVEMIKKNVDDKLLNDYMRQTRLVIV